MNERAGIDYLAKKLKKNYKKKGIPKKETLFRYGSNQISPRATFKDLIFSFYIFITFCFICYLITKKKL